MTALPHSRILGALLLVVVSFGCRKKQERHQHASDHPEGHDHHAEDHGHGGVPVVRITRYSDRFELFAEHPPAIAGQKVAVLAHLTVLQGFRPLTVGEVALELEGATPIRARATKPERPGIYRLTFKAPEPGQYRGRLVVRGAVEGTVGGLELRVYENAQIAGASSPKDAHEPGTIEFLKEQQWGVPFRTVFAETGSLVSSIEVAGNVDTPPGGSAEVGAPVAGRLVPLATGLPKPGDAVKKGQTLASLQPAPSSPEDAARATFAVSEAEARAVAARSAVERAERLIKDDAISVRELEDARREVAVAEQAVRAARRLEGVFAGASAGTGGAVWRLVAPIDGTLVSVVATPGAVASPGQVMFRIVDTDELWIRGRIPEQDAPRIRSDRDAAYKITGTENWATIDVTGPDATAAVVSVGRIVDPLSRTVDVLYSLRQPDPNLRVGGLVQVSIPAGDDFTGVVVPASSLVDQDGRQAVYVQLDGEHFAERSVRVGPRAGARVGILEGLGSGERIVTEGAHLVRLSDRTKTTEAHGHIH
jgi:membrane fusion protein, heavy metal efflux system